MKPYLCKYIPWIGTELQICPQVFLQTIDCQKDPMSLMSSCCLAHVEFLLTNDILRDPMFAVSSFGQTRKELDHELHFRHI